MSKFAINFIIFFFKESGFRKRALVVGIRNYLGKKFKSLSVTALNDIKDMTTVLQQVTNRNMGGVEKGSMYVQYVQGI